MLFGLYNSAEAALNGDSFGHFVVQAYLEEFPDLARDSFGGGRGGKIEQLIKLINQTHNEMEYSGTDLTPYGLKDIDTQTEYWKERLAEGGTLRNRSRAKFWRKDDIQREGGNKFGWGKTIVLGELDFTTWLAEQNTSVEEISSTLSGGSPSSSSLVSVTNYEPPTSTYTGSPSSSRSVSPETAPASDNRRAHPFADEFKRVKERAKNSKTLGETKNTAGISQGVTNPNFVTAYNAERYNDTKADGRVI